jgi:hypothetical protein
MKSSIEMRIGEIIDNTCTGKQYYQLESKGEVVGESDIKFHESGPTDRSIHRVVWMLFTGCFKNSFTMIFQMLLYGECCENVYT